MIEKNSDFLLSLPLFEGFSQADLSSISPCLQARLKTYKKGDIIWLQGHTLSELGLVLKGMVEITSTDIAGNTFLMERIQEGNIFAGVLLCAQVPKSPFSVSAAQDCTVLFLNYGKLISPCAKACGNHNLIIKNLLKIIARRNMFLNNRLQLLTQKNIKESLLKYFKDLASRQTSFSFKLPLTRTALAAYLCVNRSALQRQLAQMQKEGLIKMKGSRVTLSKKAL